MPSLPDKPTRKHIIGFRLTDDEMGRLQEFTRGLPAKRSASDAARGIVCHVIKIKVPDAPAPRINKTKRLPAVEVQALAKLTAAIGHIGGNVNQLAKRANESGIIPDIRVLTALQSEIADIRAQITSALTGGTS